MKHQQPVYKTLLSIMNGIPHGVAILDNDFRLQGMNHYLEALTGYGSEEVRGVEADYILHRNFVHRNDLYEKAVKSGDQVSVEGDLINSNRKKIQIRITVTNFNDEAIGTAGLLVFVEDMSLLKELEQSKHGIIAKTKGILGHSPQMQEVLDLLPVLAHTDATALITGETGTGKDLFAEAIHHASKRAKYPFIKVNCGALPESLLESELFGHARGAFTGAHSDKPGMFRLAQGGTIFLTEIGDLPLPLQVKLLTVLDDKAFFPLGSSKKVQVDVRVIAGTHRDLRTLVDEGRFRQDLFFRLNVLNVHLPPLRDRDGDIRLLVDHFLQQFSAHLQKEFKGFSAGALDLLLKYNYPGNVRELRNIIEYAANICKSGTITPEYLPDYIQRAHSTGGITAAPSVRSGLKSTAKAEETDQYSRDADLLSGADDWKEVEKKMIMETLLQCKGNRGLAAQKLGWGRSTLWRKIKQHKIV